MLDELIAFSTSYDFDCHYTNIIGRDFLLFVHVPGVVLISPLLYVLLIFLFIISYTVVRCS